MLEKLIRANQRYKSKMAFAKSNPKSKLKAENGLYHIDYTQSWTAKDSSFDVEMSFTLLDWRITDLIVNDDTFNVGNIDAEQ